MDLKFAIRAGIFLVAALLLLIFPEQVYKFQTKVMYPIRKRSVSEYSPIFYKVMGIVFLVISAILLVVALII